MRLVATCLLAMVTSGAMAQERISAEEFLVWPHDYRGQRVRLGPIGCIDDPRSTFKCFTLAAGQALLIEGRSLGASTSQAIAESLLGRCRGTANIDAVACQFEIQITPTSVDKQLIEFDDGSRQRVRVTSNEIDFFSVSRPPGRRTGR